MSHAHTGIPIANIGRADDMAAAYGLPPIPVGAVKDRRLAIRNAVVPSEGYDIATAAFGYELAHRSGEPSPCAGCGGDGVQIDDDPESTRQIVSTCGECRGSGSAVQDHTNR